MGDSLLGRSSVTGSSVPGWEGGWAGPGPFLVFVKMVDIYLITLDLHFSFLAGKLPAIELRKDEPSSLEQGEAASLEVPGRGCIRAVGSLHDLPLGTMSSL